MPDAVDVEFDAWLQERTTLVDNGESLTGIDVETLSSGSRERSDLPTNTALRSG